MISRRSAPGCTLAHSDSEHADPRGSLFLRYCSPTLTAVLVDAGFFLKQAMHIYGHQTPEATSKQLHRIALAHLNDDQGRRIARLYRIFVYDAPPAEWKGHTPVSKKFVNCGTSELAQWRRSFHESLKSLRKIAYVLVTYPQRMCVGSSHRLHSRN